VLTLSVYSLNKQLTLRLALVAVDLLDDTNNQKLEMGKLCFRFIRVFARWDIRPSCPSGC
jgi:hypothetical protein